MVAAHIIRHYSQHAPRHAQSSLKGYAVTGYLVAAFTLPFLPPYLATKRSERDGSWATRKPLGYTYCYRPLH